MNRPRLKNPHRDNEFAKTFNRIVYAPNPTDSPRVAQRKQRRFAIKERRRKRRYKKAVSRETHPLALQ